MDSLILDLLKGMDGKIDRIFQSIADEKLKNVEQSHKLDSLQDKVEHLSATYGSIEDRLKKIEDVVITKKDIDVLFERVRKLEDTPKNKVFTRIDFIKKALLAGLATIITGSVLFMGQAIWKLIFSLDSIIEVVIEAVENLK